MRTLSIAPSRQSRSARWAVALLLGALVTAGCTDSNDPPNNSANGPVPVCEGFPSGGDATTLEPIGHTGGEIVDSHPADVETFNPLLGGFEVWEWSTALIFDRLVELNPDDGLPFANLAEEVPTTKNGGVSPDETEYTFKLRSGITWHDGEPFSAADVVFTYDILREADLGSPFTAEVVDRIQSVEAVDDLTVKFKLTKPVASFLTTNMYRIVPEHILADVPPAEIVESAFTTGDPSATIGTGPFAFEERRSADVFSLAANPDYFCGAPALDRYIFRASQDFTGGYLLLQNGEVDVHSLDSSAPITESNDQINIYNYESIFSTNLLFNIQRAPLDDQRVRQALMYAMDREALATATGGTSRVVDGALHPASFAFSEDVTPAYRPDLDRAKELLEEAGWQQDGDSWTRDGETLEVDLWTNSGNLPREDAAAALQQQWGALGVKVNVNTEDITTFQQRYEEGGDYDVSLLGFIHFFDPDDLNQYYSSTGARNYVGYSNPEVDRLLAEGLATTDIAERTEIYGQIESIVMEDLPIAFLWYNGNTKGVSTRVHNVLPNAVAMELNRWNAWSWWVDG